MVTTVRGIEHALARRIDDRILRPLDHGMRRRRARAHLIHIGKTGGTALRHALTQAPRQSRYEILVHGHETCLRDIPVGDKVFFVLRDPLDRFISGFNSRLRRGAPRYNVEWTEAERAAFEQFSSADSLGRALSDSDTEVRSRAFTAMMSIGHVRDTYWQWFDNRDYLDSRRADILMIIWLPDIETTFPRLKNLLGVAGDVSLPSDDLLSHRSPAHVDRRLSEIAATNLERWYGRDFAFIDYCAGLESFAAPSRVSISVAPPGSGQRRA